MMPSCGCATSIAIAIFLSSLSLLFLSQIAVKHNLRICLCLPTLQPMFCAARSLSFSWVRSLARSFSVSLSISISLFVCLSLFLSLSLSLSLSEIQEPPKWGPTPNSRTLTLAWGRGYLDEQNKCGHYQGGIFMASTVDNSCRAWNATVKQPEVVVGQLGDVEHLRGALGVGHTPKAGELVRFAWGNLFWLIHLFLS